MDDVLGMEMWNMIVRETVIFVSAIRVIYGTKKAPIMVISAWIYDWIMIGLMSIYLTIAHYNVKSLHNQY